MLQCLHFVIFTFMYLFIYLLICLFDFLADIFIYLDTTLIFLFLYFKYSKDLENMKHGVLS